MKRPRHPLPDEVKVGARLQRYCACGRRRGQYEVIRVGGGRKEAWALPTRGPRDWPLILRFGDFHVTYGTHFKVLNKPQGMGPAATEE
jgi:hypothetical protein